MERVVQEEREAHGASSGRPGKAFGGSYLLDFNIPDVDMLFSPASSDFHFSSVICRELFCIFNAFLEEKGGGSSSRFGDE